jgi:subtilisin family serine protease
LAYQETVGRIYGRLVNALPWSVVADAIKHKESSLDIETSALSVATLRREIDPTVLQSGSVSDEGAEAILESRHFMRVVEPVQPQLLAVLKSYITAHNIEKPDIWAAREVTLSPHEHLTPVLVGIWDSGVDTSLYAQQLYTDSQPGDHSPHGLAFDDEGNLSASDLQPQTDEQRNSYPQMLLLFQGFDDLQNQIDSPDAAAVRKWSSSTPPEQLPEMLKLLNFAGNFAHGTHVAGIAARGNPAVRLVVARFNDNLPEYPFPPTVQWAAKFAADFKMLGEYFRTHHVRVVNMSWGDNVAEFETWLSKTSPEKRKAKAAAIYRVWRGGIEQALRSSPTTLFVVAAGNSDSNAGFLGDVPASLRLPNMISVGAVNQAGEATTFTSYGDTVLVHAAGYRVESFVPGGRIMRFSGTSMASPNVVNLAAKLLALDPDLTPEQVIALIRRGADTSADGRLHVINPKATVALLPSRR